MVDQWVNYSVEQLAFSMAAKSGCEMAVQTVDSMAIWTVCKTVGVWVDLLVDWTVVQLARQTVV
jgi:hypothetical protein